MPSPKFRTSASFCDACGERIIWATTQSGAHQALDFQSNPRGSVMAYQDVDGWHARSTATGTDPRHPLERVYMPHEATCRGPKQLTTV